MEFTDWYPLQGLLEDIPLALMILNQPITLPKSNFDCLWKKAVTRRTADGGTNRLYDYVGDEIKKYIPDRITGDFDSILPHIKQFYKDQNVAVVETPDQDHTDFTKALTILANDIKNKKIDSIIVLGAYGGRLDQVMANLNTLFEAEKLTPVKVLLLAEDQVAFLLNCGKHRVHIPEHVLVEWCGLIPLGKPCEHITTTGLKWNLDNDRMQFGDLISTSNCLAFSGAGCVSVETDGPLLWTMHYTLTD